jgi:hypothetical protein
MTKKITSKKVIMAMTAPVKNKQELVTQAECESLSAISSKDKGVLATAPSVNNAAVIESFQANIMGKDADLGGMIEALELSIQKVGKDDLSGLESMLVGQATALQTIFTSLARKAAVQEYPVNTC